MGLEELPETPQVRPLRALQHLAHSRLDIILVRMTSDSIKPIEQRYRYSNALTGLISLVKAEGLKGLTRGLGANTVRQLRLHPQQ